jgi:hypothetical protein
MTLTTSQDEAIGAAIGSIFPGPGNVIGTAAGALYGVVSGMFAAGAATNANRQAQVTFFASAALLGSPLAVQYILGGTLNCVASEVAMFNSAATTVKTQAPEIWQEGVTAGPLWDATSFPAMQAAVNASLLASSSSSASSNGGSASLGTMLLIAGAVATVGLVLTRRAPQPS